MAMRSTESSTAKSSSADAPVLPPAEAAPAKAALSIVGAITAALVAVAVAVSHNTDHDNTPRLDLRYCEGGLRKRPAWALAQPRRFAPEPPRDGAAGIHAREQDL